MHNNFRNAVFWGIPLGLLAIFISWLLLGDGSPFYDDALIPSPLVRIWQILNIPAGFALVAFRSLPVAMLVVFVQWFLVGFSVSTLANRSRKKPNNTVPKHN